MQCESSSIKYLFLLFYKREIFKNAKKVDIFITIKERVVFNCHGLWLVDYQNFSRSKIIVNQKRIKSI